MKKIALTLIVALSTYSVSNAQLLAFGVKGGSNLTKITGSSFDEKYETGYHAGGFVQVNLTKKLTIQPEVMFSQINTTVDSNFHNLYNNLLNNNYRKNIQLKYLTIPVVVNYNFTKYVALQGGVQYAKLMDGSKNLLQNGKSAFKEGDMSALAGLQINLGKIMLSGRYLIGLNNLNDIDNMDNWKNQTAQISLGLRL